MKGDGYSWEKRSWAYKAAFQDASSYIRKHDFVHYLPVIVQPTDLANESWAFIWAAIRYYDNLTDNEGLSYEEKEELHEKIWKVAHEIYNNSFDAERIDNRLIEWLYFYIKNDIEYEFNTYEYLVQLYKSNVEDHRRRGKIYSEKQLRELIYKKAACFFKVMYSLGFGLNEKLCEHIGRALQIVDDVLDMEHDLSVGQINITREEIEKFGIDISSPTLLTDLEKKGFYDYRAEQVLQHIKRARDIAQEIEDKWTRKFSLMATEIIAAPILENRFRPGEKYYVKGGRLLDSLLPKDEKKAYRRGHKLIKMLCRFFPQCNRKLLEKKLEELPDEEPRL